MEVCARVWREHGSPSHPWLSQWGTDKPVEALVDGNLYQSAVDGQIVQIYECI